MAKTKISEFDSNPANNTDIDGINLAEGMAPGLVNNAIRELMAQLKDFQAGLAGDNVSVGGNLSVTGTTTLTGAATLGGNTIDALPSGTKMLFNQTAAPTGWTKDTTHNDKALRVVSGTAGTGGSVAFTTAFANQNVGDTTLTEAQIPSHTHAVSGTTGGHSADHNHGFSGTTGGGGAHSHGLQFRNGGVGALSDAVPGSQGTSIGFIGGAIGGVGDHVHGFSGTTGGTSGNHTHDFNVTSGARGGGGSHTHTLDIAVSYVDVIIATKD